MDHCDIKWLALEMNRDHSVIFEIASKYCILISFRTDWFDHSRNKDLLEITPKKMFFALTSNAEKAEVKWFYEDLQDLLELTP